ncbi:MAG: tagaturonate epimerase family protein [Spirochaetaceae bacterium]|jgi:hypothetical protein|nr:tagaturonate epimerase family protein [Spirochaetaceae bacterium]
MSYLGFEVYEKSINPIGSSVVFMAKEKNERVLIAAPAESGKPAPILGFTGEIHNGIFRAPLTHANGEVLRKLFPFTKPVRGLTQAKSFGTGDRLGIATPGHIQVFERYDVFPVFAQQSIRELNLTDRTYEDVLDAATFGVFQEGFKSGFGADGDHLKTIKDVEYALSLGFSMITLDCSDYIQPPPPDLPPLSAKYREAYLGKTFDIEGTPLVFTEPEAQQCVAIYAGAIAFAAEVYNRFFGSRKYQGDFEISIDETSTPTTPLQHFFVAQELLKAGVSFATLAPRFCGEFQKGIDYKGDLDQFDQEVKIHAAIARHFGYKLSIHSGSDKFSVFPSIGRGTQGVFHVKTAGTSWLEAMRIVAAADPKLYREIHSYALRVFHIATQYYQVTTDLKKIPPLDALKDENLPALFENNDARQLLHITYGLILKGKHPDGSFIFKERLYRLWRDREADYAEALARHIGKHLTFLGVAPR